MIIEGMELKALQLEQEKPFTMVKVSHVSNGVTYEARGWALWDGQQEWSDREGQRIAVLRAKRKIAKRLRWEYALVEQGHIYDEQVEEAEIAARNAHSNLLDVKLLHRDSGTVRL